MYTPLSRPMSPPASYSLRRRTGVGAPRTATFRAMSGLGGLLGLGYDVVIGTPIGNQTITVPLEDMARVMGKDAANAAWAVLKPQIQTTANQIVDLANKTADQIVDRETKRVTGAATSTIGSAAAPALLGVLAVAAIGGGGYLLWKKKRARQGLK